MTDQTYHEERVAQAIRQIRIGAIQFEYGPTSMMNITLANVEPLIAAVAARERRDTDRLDALEAEALKEALTLHDGTLPLKGMMQTRGLGFGPRLGRSLREAIDGIRPFAALDAALSATPPEEHSTIESADLSSLNDKVGVRMSVGFAYTCPRCGASVVNSTHTCPPAPSDREET